MGPHMGMIPVNPFDRRAAAWLVLASLILAPASRAFSDDDTSATSPPAPTTQDAATAGHDVVVTRDGQRYEGTLHRQAGQWTMTLTNGSTVDVTPGDVTSISLGSHASGADAAASALASLRRSLDAVSDPAVAIQRCQRFIDQNPGSPAAEDATQDLAQWQLRKQQGLVKVGSKWVTTQDRQRMRAQATLLARQAAVDLSQNDFKNAEAVLKDALDDDPDHVAALYLRGLIDFQQGQVAVARKRFEAVNAQIVHAPTLNNLAVIYFRQNQTQMSLKFYDQSIELAPLSRDLLNNVAEALAVLTDDQRRSPNAVLLADHFLQQDQKLQELLASGGLYRWGATWVDADTLKHLQDVQKDVDSQLDALKKENDDQKDRMQQIQRLTDEDQQRMRQLSWQQMNVVDPRTGAIYQQTLPQEYYDLQDKVHALKVEYDQLHYKISQYDEKVRKVTQQLPVPKYTGRQMLIGVDGAPFESGPADAQILATWPMPPATKAAGGPEGPAPTTRPRPATMPPSSAPAGSSAQNPVPGASAASQPG